MGINHRRAVFLDRDGVINRSIVRNGLPCGPTSLDELEVLPDVPDALERLQAAGFDLVVVTNQPNVSRGIHTRELVDQMHARLARMLPIDEFFVCPHDDVDQCECRKPKPGLLLQAAAKRRLSLNESFMVGDRWRDVDAGKAAGCATIFVDRGYTERRPDRPDAVVGSLAEAADWILGRARSTS